MKIGINATCINNRPSGANQRFLGIYNELFHLMPESEFIIYHSFDTDITSWFKSPNVRYIKTPIHSEGGFSKFFYHLTFWQKEFRAENFDLFESLNLPIVQSNTCKTFQTIHDIRSISLPESSARKFLSKLIHFQAIKKANKIITVSDTMKHEILSYFPEANVARIYNGIDLKSFTSVDESECDSLKLKMNLPDNFLLSVGHFEKRKNYARLIEAIKLLKSNGIIKPLVIIGNDSGTKKEVQKKIFQLGLQEQIKIFSNISSLDFKLICKMSDIFIFPSLYEGFGIPVLEAMAFEKPIILSNIPVFQEITQMKYLYFDPNNPFDIAKALEPIIFNKNLASNSIEYGRKRINDFSFPKVASELMDLYSQQYENT
jgi:glycosyltransferase involved in cell wall biosynthesis